MSSILKVDTIQTTAGAAPTTKDLGFAAGSVIQVVRRDPTAAAITRYSGTSTSYANTGLAISITPKYANSLVIVRGFINTGAPSNAYFYLTLKRVISGGSTTDLGFTGSGTNFGVAQHGVSGGGNLWHQASFEYPDAPNTTSAITYQVWAKNNSGSGTHYVGWTGGTDTTHNGMFLTATEIAQ